MMRIFRAAYIEESGLPAQSVDLAFREMDPDMPRRLDEVDQETARKYSGTTLPSRKIGEGKFREYYGKAQGEESVMRWTENVMRRLRKLPARKGSDARNTEGGRS